MYRLGIWLIALAVVFNGAASYASIDLAAAPALAVQHHHNSSADSRSGRQDVAAATDYGQHYQYDHNGLKCCRTCTVASVLPEPAAISVPFSYDVVTFRAGQHDLVGYFLILDPDIPRTFV